MAKQKKTIVDQLKDTIRKSGKTHYRIAKDAGIGPGQIDCFMNDTRPNIRLLTAAKIAEALNLELKPKDK